MDSPSPAELDRMYEEWLNGNLGHELTRAEETVLEARYDQEYEDEASGVPANLAAEVQQYYRRQMARD